jgi:hypothetical protein
VSSQPRKACRLGTRLDDVTDTIQSRIADSGCRLRTAERTCLATVSRAVVAPRLRKPSPDYSREAGRQAGELLLPADPRLRHRDRRPWRSCSGPARRPPARRCAAISAASSGISARAGHRRAATGSAASADAGLLAAIQASSPICPPTPIHGFMISCAANLEGRPAPNLSGFIPKAFTFDLQGPIRASQWM